MSATARIDGDERHRAAVANTLVWADQAAADGRYRDALEWLATIEAIGDVLPKSYLTKRSAWSAASGSAPARRAGQSGR